MSRKRGVQSAMRATRIVIFAKAPVAGQVKTRLIPALGAQGAAELARRMLGHTLAQALAAQLGPVELCVTAPADPAWRTAAVPPGVEWTDQGEGDLGVRMARAARRSLAADHSVLLIGTDCPALDAGRLRDAAAALQHSDASLIPTADGGYVLLGLKRFHRRLFEDIAWSTPHVAQETRRRLTALGWTVQEAAPLHDIDEPADLRWLPADWPGASVSPSMTPRS